MNAKAKTKTNAHANNVKVFGNALILINLMLSSWPITMAKMKMKISKTKLSSMKNFER